MTNAVDGARHRLDRMHERWSDLTVWEARTAFARSREWETEPLGYA